LCCVVLCCVVLCCVVLCCVVLCCVVLCCVVWCGVVWCGVVWCGVVWCCVVWCGVVWCCSVLFFMFVLNSSTQRPALKLSSESNEKIFLFIEKSDLKVDRSMKLAAVINISLLTTSLFLCQVYVILVSIKGSPMYRITRRFKQFYELDVQIRLVHKKESLPFLPKKHIAFKGLPIFLEFNYFPQIKKRNESINYARTSFNFTVILERACINSQDCEFFNF